MHQSNTRVYDVVDVREYSNLDSKTAIGYKELVFWWAGLITQMKS